MQFSVLLSLRVTQPTWMETWI